MHMSISLTRDDKIVFLYLKGWPAYEWSDTSTMDYKQHFRARLLNQPVRAMYPNIDPDDLDDECLLFMRPGVGSGGHLFYTPDLAYEEAIRDSRG
jgi:hypothetical protein